MITLASSRILELDATVREEWPLARNRHKIKERLYDRTGFCFGNYFEMAY
jgi:hypothetical protein